MSTKYIFITGGVVSGLGKGITAAVLGSLLKARGCKVRNQKFDPYLNIDPSLMSPTQHGEIFITEDGAENDLDIGHYERFTGVNLDVESDVTSGKVYTSVISRERTGCYGGGTIQVVPHVINEIKDHIYNVAKADDEDTDVVISEIGGTVGDIEGLPYIEAIRQVSYDAGRENCLFVHVTLVPYLHKTKELKTKPTQHSVQKLLSLGIQPDVLVCRAEIPITQDIREKIGAFCNVKPDAVIQNIDCESVYELPLAMENEGFAKVVCEKLRIRENVEPDLTAWRHLVDKINSDRKPLNIALVGKYTALRDAYYSILESLEHASVELGYKQNIDFVESEELENKTDDEVVKRLAGAQAIIVPGGFGPRGMEGMVAAAKYAREHKVPFLGIGLGMQMGVIEIARNMLGMKDANTDEAETECRDIFYLPNLTAAERHNIADMLFTDLPIRSGSYDFKIEEDSVLNEIYGSATGAERHHHRRELNPAYLTELAASGLRVSAVSADDQLVEAVELPKAMHPFYLGTLFHPEFKSRPIKPHPIFLAFIKSAAELV